MSVQDTYAINHGIAYAGMVADMQLVNSVSRLNKTGSVIEYGLGVVSDGDDGMQIGSARAVAAEFNGVVMYELNRAQVEGDPAGVPDKRDGTVVSDGVIWVKVLDAVSKDDPVYLRVGATDQGNFSGIAGAGATEGLLLPSAKFESSAAADELVKISLTIGG